MSGSPQPPAPRTPALPQGPDKVRAVRSMFDAIAPRYDLVNRVMTFGLDMAWRRASVRALELGPGATVCDIATGTGDLCRQLARHGYRPIGIDLSLGMLRQGSTGMPLIQGDALRLPIADSSVEGAISGFALRNFAELGPFFDELGRVVQRGGRIALLDVATPGNPLLRAGHGLYFRHVVPRIGAVLSDGAAYRYLPQSVAYLPPATVMLDRLRAAGFGAVQRRLLSGGIAQLITATRTISSPGPRQ